MNRIVVGQTPASATGTTTAGAILRASGLAHGTHSVTAVYLGDGNYRAGATTIWLTVN